MEEQVQQQQVGSASNATASNDNVVLNNNNSENAEEQENTEIDIIINNVVSTFYTRCHLDLRKIATNGMNVVYRKENGMVSMKFRKPSVTASIWSSGKVTCTGSTSEEDSKVAARTVARRLWRLGFEAVKFCRFRIVNVLGTCSLPFKIQITEFSRNNPKMASYEPELHPGVTYKILDPKATIKIFSTGSLTVTAPSVANVQAAIEHIYSKVYEYRIEGPTEIASNDDYDSEAYQLFLHHTNNNTNLITYKKNKSGKCSLSGPHSKKQKFMRGRVDDEENWSDSDDD
ncbi:hypothetical protein HELRODRAFT_188693 [Helobdella robusta]|uniref:TATA box-binding protein-like 1 n=1 Tax=Helobdella robusta TaxID=6412 RepID=T1FQ96_HELRO|nr:hypothetical protein HELRODRAFT_188693 [Helobdella robusta]ESO02411.1 hypothetical protein HELRODRAFT_188693 [Helobdella robusta]